MFDHIQFSQGELRGIWLDITSMFHNLGLPPAFVDLFPLPIIAFGELSPETQNRIRATLPDIDINASTLLRPAQRTMPMGFTWAVVLAHDAMTNIVRTAYSVTCMSKTSHPAPHPLQFMSRNDAPFLLPPGAALALAIIDDISIIVNNWPHSRITLLHRTLRTLLIAAGLPIAEQKSLPVDEIEDKVIPFVGMEVNLVTKLVTPMTSRITKLAAFVKSHSFARSITYTV